MNESLSILSGNVLPLSNKDLHISSSVVKSKYGKCSFTSDGHYEYVLNLRKAKRLATDKIYKDKINYGLKHKNGQTFIETFFINLKGKSEGAFIMNEEPDKDNENKQEKIPQVEVPINEFKEEVPLEEDSSLVQPPVQAMKWLETQGQFTLYTSSTGEEEFVAENKSQAAYLTKFGGAVTLGFGGKWQYLIGTQSLDIKEGETLVDRVLIGSQDGSKHEIFVSIQDEEGKAFISNVSYTQSTNKDTVDIKANSESKAILHEENIEDKKREKREALLGLNEETLQEDTGSLYENLMDISQAFEEAEQEFPHQEPLDENPALSYEIKEESHTNTKPEEMLVNEEEMLSKVQDLMLVKQKEKTQALKKKQEEAQLAEQKAQTKKQEIKKDIIGGDEMLLKIQAMMNAPKTIDLDSIEIVNQDVPTKEIKGTTAEQVTKKTVISKIKEEPKDNVLKGKIQLEDKETRYKSSFYLDGFHLKEDGAYSFELNPIAYDYLKDNQKELHKVSVYAEQRNGENLLGFLSIEVKRERQEFLLSSQQGAFSKQENNHAAKVEMSLEDLAANGEEFSHEGEGKETMQGNLAVIFDSLKEGKKLNSDGTLGITIVLPTGVQAGEIITVDGHEFSITGDEADARKMLYAVYPEDEVEVSYRDKDNNISDSLRAKANEDSVELLEFSLSPERVGEVGSQSMHAGIGVAETQEKAWGIMNEHGSIVSLNDSEFARVHVDSETGEIEYRYCEGLGLKKYGKSADNLVCEKFILTKGKDAYAQLEVTLHIQAESIHGYSGQEIDSTTIKEMKLIKIDRSYKPKTIEKNTEMLDMFITSLNSTNTKISKLMISISEARSTGKDISEAKKNLLALSEKKVLLQNKIQSLT